MIDIKTILLVEDNPQDVELTLVALSEHNLANNVVSVSDGVEAMEFLRDRLMQTKSNEEFLISMNGS